VAGPLDIQRLPYGLVDLLGMKGSGDTPHSLAENIAVTLADGADYYLAPRRVVLQGDTAINIAATGFFAAVGIAPSAGEVWLVYNVTLSLNNATAAATALKIWGTYVKSSTATLDCQITDQLVLGATDWGSTYRQFERPQLFLPGDSFGVRCGSLTGVPAAKGRITVDVARITL
jgi:hypothetical protein